jgi:hypothetical protein
MESRSYSHITTRSLSILALILSLAALIAAVVAIQSANNSSAKVAGQDSKISELDKEVKLLNRPATSGGGVGPNSTTQTVVPTGSGQ